MALILEGRPRLKHAAGRLDARHIRLGKIQIFSNFNCYYPPCFFGYLVGPVCLIFNGK